jgi:copper resistance protein D
MTIALYQFLVFTHVLAAIFWLGGMFFLGMVGAPVLRQVEPPSLRARLFRDLGLTFRRWGWLAIGTLILSGTGILHLRGLLRWDNLADPGWWATGMGTALAWKLALVGLMVTLSALHDFWIGPGASRSTRMRRWAAFLARGNAALGLVLVFWATRLARGG